MTNNPSQKCECDFDSPCCGAKKSIGHCLSCQKSESPAPPKLNVKGQCPYCSKKPLMYKRDGGYYFCTRCNRQWDLTGNFQENFMWDRNNKCKHPGRPKNSSCPDCGEWDTESRQNNDNLGKAMQPVGGVSGDKPSTGEDWEKEFDQDEAILGIDAEMNECNRESLKVFIRSLLQQERARCAGIVEKILSRTISSDEYNDEWPKAKQPKR